MNEGKTNLVIFGCNDAHPDYVRMSAAWKASVRETNPRAVLLHQALHKAKPYPEHVQFFKDRAEACVANTIKLNAWVRAFRTARLMGNRIVLMDTDTYVLGSLEEAFLEGIDGRPCDVLITERPYKVPFNAGVVFAQPTPGAEEFMAAWLRWNATIFFNPDRFHDKVHAAGGINQAALTELLAEGLPGVRIGRLRCEIWNCEQTSWNKFDKNKTKVVHLKGDLRRRCLETSQKGDQNGSTRDQMVYFFRRWEGNQEK